jgi:hypothetical protein
MRRLFRLAVLVGIGIWVWRTLLGRPRLQERAATAFADGSSLVLEPGSEAFERLAVVARRALAP